MRAKKDRDLVGSSASDAARGFAYVALTTLLAALIYVAVTGALKPASITRQHDSAAAIGIGPAGKSEPKLPPAARARAAERTRQAAPAMTLVANSSVVADAGPAARSLARPCALGFRDGLACCHTSCGACSSDGCSKRAGGRPRCCPVRLHRECANSTDVACRISPKGRRVARQDACISGIRDAPKKAPSTVCCAKTCGVCSVKGCSKRPGGGSHCCPTRILMLGRPCSDPHDEACVMPDPTHRS